MRMNANAPAHFRVRGRPGRTLPVHERERRTVLRALRFSLRRDAARSSGTAEGPGFVPGSSPCLPLPRRHGDADSPPPPSRDGRRITEENASVYVRARSLGERLRWGRVSRRGSSRAGLPERRRATAPSWRRARAGAAPALRRGAPSSLLSRRATAPSSAPALVFFVRGRATAPSTVSVGGDGRAGGALLRNCCQRVGGGPEDPRNIVRTPRDGPEKEYVQHKIRTDGARV